MALNWFLIVVVVLMSFVFLAANVYILVYFQHPDDKNTAYFPKLLVIFGLLLAEACVLLLPLDVANNSTAIGCDAGWNGSCGNLDMEVLWLIVFMAIVVFLVLLLPFAIYYYEGDDDLDGAKAASRWLDALKMEVGTLVVVAIVIAITYSTSSTSTIPYDAIVMSSIPNGSIPITSVNGTNVTHSTIVVPSALAAYSGFHAFTDGSVLSSDERLAALTHPVQATNMTVAVSVPIYITALFSFVGWFAFTIFVAIGLIALPLDLILAFFYRPRFMPADIYAQQKMLIQIRSLELLEVGKEIKAQQLTVTGSKLSLRERQKQARQDLLMMNKFKQAVYLLEKDVQELKLCHEDYKNYNPLVPIGKLVLGFLCSIVSFLWVLQIILAMLPRVPIVPFLNNYFLWFDSWFPLFGTISVGLFTLYLLACCVKGCFKFGMRCFCCALHPMEFNGTYMNSFLFNLTLILLCCIPCVQFANQAFGDYVRLTTIQTMMGVQLKYMKGFTFFWAKNVFLYILLALAFLTLIYLAIRPRDTSSKTDKIRKKIEKQVRLATA
ncbi:hypothetical protein SDRG_17049 [Saprolegnia diclina VS20]|uniref:LIMR family protein n=1 Tax=Saprolegnia diclina (strain VS20) TaxID=1156394 RepID=T0QZ94_SAPDV|nr:hypothetical protein SDRG_17049 [Saprolegnia diclina VS20]EQC25073.1 hypothetical protein SDRG_17049 [Saprolegnia diclina VS20]|eukprot:XP_008621503.1 hypothetical protein SDRG_17049 [Saprolegnia diclina VS20]